MNVIWHSSNFQEHAFLISDDSSDVFLKFIAK